MSEVEPQDVEWVWYPYIPLAKLVMVDGFEGLGKTMLLLYVLAAITRGFPLPGDDREREPARVLYLTAEDGLADTLRPRLDDAEADLGLFSVIDGAIDAKGEETCIALEDLGVIEAALAEVRPLVFVIDPLMAYLTGDSSKGNQVRPVLTKLAALAERYGCTIICVRHFRKSTAGRASHRGVGSVEISAQARSVLAVAEDPDDPRLRLLAHAKMNLAAKGVSQRFEITDEGKFLWAGTSTATADDALEARDDEEQTPRSEATEFLRGVLANGPVRQKDVQKEARDAGIAERTLRRAKRALGVKSKHIANGNRTCWTWVLPASAMEATT
jgi:RecA-family ATPase